VTWAERFAVGLHGSGAAVIEPGPRPIGRLDSFDAVPTSIRLRGSLLLVRHAMPDASADTPPGEWLCWEPHAELAARFAAGVRHWRTVAGDRPLVVASHGMAMTIWLAAAATLANPGAFWAALRFPDLLAVDLGESTVTRAYQAAGA
jgi:hypothetical protein